MSAQLHLLDTDTASYLIKGRAPAAEARLAALPPDAIGISAVTRAELMYGLKKLPPAHRLNTVVRQFLTLTHAHAWGAGAADWHANIRHQLTGAGQPIGEMDLTIAAHALSLGAVLVTNNTHHFARITAPLLLANWAQPLR